MKVLISAGAKTSSIIDRIQSKLSSGGVDFVVVPFLENIDDIYQRGEWFDRAIILEQSWSHDFTDTDVASMRLRINEFANQSADRGIDNISFVFLTQEEGTASQVYEEILPIQTNTVVLMKKPKYKVSFMVELVTTELGKFPSDIVYQPRFEAEVDVQSEPTQPETPEEPEIKINYTDDVDGYDRGIYDGDGLPMGMSEPLQPQFGDSEDPFNWGDTPVAERPLDPKQPNWAPTTPPIQQAFASDIPTGPMPTMQPASTRIQPTNPGMAGMAGAGMVGAGASAGGMGTADIPSYPKAPSILDKQGFDDIGVQPQGGFEQGIDVGSEQPGQFSGGYDIGFDGQGSFEEPPVITPGAQDSYMGQQDYPGYGEEQMGDYPQHPSGEIPDYSYGQEESLQQSGEIPDYSGGMEEDLYGQPQSGDIPDYSSQPQGQQEGIYGDIYNDQQEQGYEQYNPEMDSVYQQPSDIDMGYGGRNVVAPPAPGRKNAKLDLNRNQIRSLLDAFANRGNSIVVTGCGGCGTSSIALNLATIINNLGYTVLLVDLDTKHKAQSYISKGNFDSLETDSAGLLAAINSASGINAHTAIVQTGFHLLTMGMNSEPFEMGKMVQKEKIARFINLAKTSHNFVIYDIPFDTATGFGKDFTFMADNIVVTVDCSNWGITKAMLDLCNIDDPDMQETIFSRGQLLFNRYRALHKVMGRKVKTAMDITKVMDYKVRELEGDDPGLYFQQMHICGLINEDAKFENGWYENIQYADTPVGSKIFVELLKNIVLKS